MDTHYPAIETNEEKIRYLIKLLMIKDDINDISLKSLKGGITNSVDLLTTPSQKYIIRVNGHNTEKIINRKREIDNIRKINFIQIFHIWDNGLIYSYQEGNVISVPMMSDPLISQQIAFQLAKFHSKTLNEQPKSNELYESIKKFLVLDPEWKGKDGKTIDIKHLVSIFDNLQDQFSKEMSDSKLLLCHNDLLAANILWDGKAVSILDYEYSCYTFPEFDIANHFFEWCGFECDLRRYPSIPQQRAFISNYLQKLNGTIPDSDLIEHWRIKVEKFVALSNFFWGTWAYFQAQNSIIHFPYYEYAKVRIMLVDYSFPLKEGDPLLSGPLIQLD